MKGIVFNMLEESVRRTYGADAWDDVLDRAGLDGAYTSLATYPDEQLLAIVGAASKALDLPPEAIVRWFGVEAAGIFSERFPGFYEAHETTRSFLLTLNNIIHPEVRKLYPEAETPSFTFESDAQDRLVMHYFSRRALCVFAEGLIIGTAPRFKEKATIEQTACVSRGDQHCILAIGFARGEG